MIEKELLSMQDIKYKEFQEKLCPNTKNIIGIRIPLLRKYAKKVLKDNYIDYLKNPLNNYQEEIMLEGMLIAYSKMDISDKIKYLEKFISKIDNWATCDIVCSSFKMNEYEKEKMFSFLTKYKKSTKEFELRFMLVMFLDYYLDKKNLNEILKIIDNIKTGDYYTDMAIAWLLSYVYINEKEVFNSYLKETKLCDDILNKTYRKILESNKVSKEDKENIKKIKQSLNL